MKKKTTITFDTPKAHGEEHFNKGDAQAHGLMFLSTVLQMSAGLSDDPEDTESFSNAMIAKLKAMSSTDLLDLAGDLKCLSESARELGRGVYVAMLASTSGFDLSKLGSE